MPDKLTTRALFFLACITLCGSLSHAEDWPRWRGPAATAVSTETGLIQEWPADGPEVAWKLENVGAAYSTVSVADGRVFTMGNVPNEDGNGNEGRIICLDEKTGKLLWSVKSPAEEKAYTHKRGDGPRGTPTVDGKLVYTEGGDGAVTCLEAATGKVVWSLHLIRDLNAPKVPGWGFSESPVIDGDHCIVTPGGKDGAVAALNKLTGEVIWRSTDVTDQAHYATATVAEIGGLKQIVQFTRDRVVGLDAKTGKLLWDYKESANGTANVASPICVDNMVFTSSAYGTGGGMVKVTKADDGTWSAKEMYFLKPMANHHGGLVYHDGHIYGFGSNSLMCMEIKTGEIVWRDRSVSKGSLVLADGQLYCFGEKNQMALVDATPKEYDEHGRFPTPDTGKPSWAHPVVANGRLYLRDQNLLTAYDIRQK